MLKALAMLTLVAALALNATAAFAGDKINRPVFFGDGFDYTTCADAAPGAPACR